MRLENQVCKREYSKRLAKLGIKQESLFYWTVGGAIYRNEMPFFLDTNYSAFTVAELGEILPNRISINERAPFDTFSLYVTKFYLMNDDNIVSNYIVNYECDITSLTGPDAWLRKKLTVNIYDTNLANAMAQMLIYLIENKLINITMIDDNK